MLKVVQATDSNWGEARRRYVKNNITNNNSKTTIGRSRGYRSTSSSAPQPPPPTPSDADNTCTVPDAMVERISTTTSSQQVIPPPASPASNRHKSLGTIRERVERIFTTGKSGSRPDRPRSKSSDRLNLHNFTFADSKIGTMMLSQRERELAAQVVYLPDFVTLSL